MADEVHGPRNDHYGTDARKVVIGETALAFALSLLAPR
jgi:hypothetical protein